MKTDAATQQKRDEEYRNARPNEGDVANELMRRLGKNGVSGLGRQVFSRVADDGPFQVIEAAVDNTGCTEIALLEISEDDLTTRANLETTEHETHRIRLFCFEEVEALRDVCDFAMRIMLRSGKGPK